MPKIMNMVSIPVHGLLKMAKTIATFITPPMLDPSLCKEAPNGIVTSLIGFATPIFSAATILAGIVATLLQVPKAVNDGTILFFQ
ncbi:hypothetical protein D3C86_2020430 [compost metagenome]